MEPLCRFRPRSHGRVWPNRGAGGLDFAVNVNVLALLHESNRIGDRLTSDITPWPHTASRSPEMCSCRAKLWIKPEFGARLGDCDRAVVVRNVVDAGLAARDRQQCRLRSSIDVQRWPARGHL